MKWLKDAIRSFIGSVSREEWIRDQDTQRQKYVAAQRETITMMLNQLQAQQESSTMTRKDQFAAAAITGLLSDPDNWSEKPSYVPDAFNIAEAMLAESERRQK